MQRGKGIGRGIDAIEDRHHAIRKLRDVECRLCSQACRAHRIDDEHEAGDRDGERIGENGAAIESLRPDEKHRRDGGGNDPDIDPHPCRLEWQRKVEGNRQTVRSRRIGQEADTEIAAAEQDEQAKGEKSFFAKRSPPSPLWGGVGWGSL